eukprot:32154-Amphidinium_carterae.1
MASAGRVPPLDFSSLALEVAAGGEADHSPVLGFSARSCGSSTYWQGSDRPVAEAGGASPIVLSEAVSEYAFTAVHHEAVAEEASSDRSA